MKILAFLMATTAVFVWGGLLAFFAIKAIDAIQAALYNRRKAQAVPKGCSDPLCPLCQPPTLIVVRRAITLWPTPDRPADPLKAAINSITGPQTAAQYPKGS